MIVIQGVINILKLGKMELVHNVLLTLYNFLNQFIDEEDNVITELPPVSFSRMLKLQNVIH